MIKLGEITYNQQSLDALKLETIKEAANLQKQYAELQNKGV